jgi:hypothetical protein
MTDTTTTTTDIKATNILATKAVLITLQLKKWNASKADKKTAREAEARKHAAKGTVSARKQLLGPNHKRTYLDACNAQEDIRTLVTSLTLPWTVPGVYLLPIKRLERFRARYAELRKVARGKLDDFILDYQSAIDEAAKPEPEGLGDLFDRKDYPTAAEIRAKFAVSASISDIPDGKNFYNSLPAAVADQMKADLEKRNNEMLSGTMTEVFQRMEKVVRDLSDRLDDDPAKIKPKAIVARMSDLIEALPDFNFADSSQIKQMGARLNVIANADFDKVKANEEGAADNLRKQTSTMLSGLEAFIGKPGLETSEEGKEGA